MFLLLLSLQLLIGDCARLEVTTPEGRLRGFSMTTRNGRRVFAFNGIPYAKPPVGDLRFSDPLPVDKWKGVRYAESYGNACPQYFYFIPTLINITVGSEDCLYLSVYTPKVSKQLPVLVHFHGGAFFTGFGEFGYSPSYLLDEDIVIVKANYRLGTLGFLSLEDDVLPGNFGLKDQLMVLKWVNKNIKYFGGDPQKVTISGESAGAASVHYHVLSPSSQGFFSQAIAASGSSFSPWAFTPPKVSRQRALRVAEYFGCSLQSSQEILNCLRKQSVTALATISKKLIEYRRDPMTVFTPIIDRHSSNPFMPIDPMKTQPPPKPLLTGVNTYEGVLRSGGFPSWPETYGYYNREPYKFFPLSMMYDWSSSDPIQTTDEIRKFYFNNKPLSQRSLINVTNMFSDSWFIWPVMAAVRNHTGPVYLYHFDYYGENSFDTLYSPRKSLHGPVHNDDQIYVWNWSALMKPLKGRDLILSKILVKLFTNFIKFGNPTKEGVDFEWDQWRPGEKYLFIGNEGMVEGSHLYDERMKFWSSLNYRDLVN